MADVDLNEIFDLRGVCRLCGGDFTLNKTGRPRVYCSDQCRVEGCKEVQKEGRKRPSLGGPSVDTVICEVCAESFTYFRKRKPRKFCSKKCTSKYFNSKLSDRQRKSRKKYAKDRYDSWAKTYLKICVTCHAEFKSRQSDSKCCSEECVRTYQRELGLEQTAAVTIWRECIGCGIRFRPYRSGRASERALQVFCSQSCRRGSPGKPAKGPSYRPRSLVDPIKVFERDGWKCHLCGVKTPKHLRGTHDDRAPERDHIVSLADGGSDTYENSACCCRKCNLRKGARSEGQLLLFG